MKSNDKAIPKTLLDCLIKQESNYNITAVSSANCKGLTQLSDATGKEMLRRMKLDGDYRPFDKWQNMVLGAAFLIDLLAKYGSVELALAAYNTGETNLDKALKLAPTKDWRGVKLVLDRVTGVSGASETRNYVGRITKNFRG